MKAIKFLSAAAILCAAVACNSNKSGASAEGADSLAVAEPVKVAENPKVVPPTKAEIDTVSYLMGINLGSMIKGYNLGDLNMNEIKKGINDFVNSKGNMRDEHFTEQFKIDPMEMNRIMGEFIEKRNAYTAEVNKQKQAEFFAKNRKKAGVEESATGLQYIISEAGNEVKPGPKDTTYVHYKLSLTDGTLVEEVPADQPSAMLLNNRVVSGWAEGISLIGEGGKIKLFVPSKLGYGERGGAQGMIQPNTPLVFDLQLDSVKRFAEPVPAAEDEKK